jgi:acyl-homoserine-lactone acylase
VHRTANAIPWVNTIATSADGRAWYADASATPNLSPEAIAGWQAAVATEGSTASLVDQNEAVLLDGNPVSCTVRADGRTPCRPSRCRTRC